LFFLELFARTGEDDWSDELIPPEMPELPPDEDRLPLELDE